MSRVCPTKTCSSLRSGQLHCGTWPRNSASDQLSYACASRLLMPWLGKAGVFPQDYLLPGLLLLGSGWVAALLILCWSHDQYCWCWWAPPLRSDTHSLSFWAGHSLGQTSLCFWSWSPTCVRPQRDGGFSVGSGLANCNFLSEDGFVIVW